MDRLTSDRGWRFHDVLCQKIPAGVSWRAGQRSLSKTRLETTAGTAGRSLILIREIFQGINYSLFCTLRLRLASRRSGLDGRGAAAKTPLGLLQRSGGSALGN